FSRRSSVWHAPSGMNSWQWPLFTKPLAEAGRTKHAANNETTSKQIEKKASDMWSANPEASAKEFGDYFLRCRDYRYRYITGVEFPGQPNVLNATQMRIAREQHSASQKRGLGQNERIVDFFLRK